MPGKSGIFISYARKDGEAFATALRARLGRDAPDVRIWVDRVEIEGGAGWWRQIEAALESVEFLVIVMTGGALDSEITRREWRYARQQGVCVYPVKGPGFELSDTRLTRWMKKAHIYDLGGEWETFLAHVRRGCQTVRVPFMAPDLPLGFVQRPAEFDRLRSLLLEPERRDPVAITTALTGAGGFGKTTLACALCHDDDVALAFDDGILWTTLGETPNVPDALAKLYAGLTGERPAFKDAEDAATVLAEKLEHRNCLIVIDDVWNPAHLEPFLRGGTGCARLITTRHADVAGEARARLVPVDEMTTGEAVDLLASRLETRPASLDTFRILAARLGEWPLLLKLAAAAIAQRIARGDTVERAATYVQAALNREGITAFDRRSDISRQTAVATTVEASLGFLDDRDRQRYLSLAIFPEDEVVPLRVVADLWQCDEFDTERSLEKLANASLVEFALGAGTVRLHDVLRAYLRTRLGKVGLVTANARLIAGWRDLRSLPHDYAWQWIGHHLHDAGQVEQLKALLLDYTWLRSKLDATDVYALVREFDYGPQESPLLRLQETLRLSAHVLARDKAKLAVQLLARLPEDESSFRSSILEAAGAAGERWLRPLRPSLTAPGGPLLRTLEGHTSAVNAVVLTADGTRAVSASFDNTLKVWDLQSGRVLRTLEGHTGTVNAVALSADGTRVVSASWDRTLKIWDLQSGRVLRTLEGHTDFVIAVALAADDTHAVSVSSHGTLKVWDLRSGREVRTLEGHVGMVNAVALTADDTRVVSASHNNTLKVWDLQSWRALRTLEGHSGQVNAVALTADGTRAVSASDDNTLKVWDLQSGHALRTLEGHMSRVAAVALTADGARAVSASWDGTLKVWDLQSGHALRTLEGHTEQVNGVVLTADGTRAVSASFDNTLKVWDLQSGRTLRALKKHSEAVNAVALTADGTVAVSASNDRTLKVWDLQGGRALRTLEGHAGPVEAVALTTDGTHAVSASWDKTLKVWDLQSGRTLRTLEGHANRVTAVALTADGAHVLSASWDHTLKVWDLRSGRALRTLEESASAVALTADGTRAVSASSDHTLKVWDLRSGRVMRTLKGHSSAVALTADGARAVSGGLDKTLKVWDLQSGRALRTLEGHTGEVIAVALAADGTRAVSASNDRTLAVWNLENGELLASFWADSPVRTCAVTTDGRTVVAGDDEGHVHFLRLENTP